MTLIVGLVHGDTVWMGGDSAGVGGNNLTLRADTKVFRNGPYLIGYTWSFRMGQILRFADLPEPKGDLYRFLCTTFIDAVRAAFKAGGFATKEHEVETGGQFLVAVSGRLFYVGQDFQVGESLAGFDAVGCGASYGLGALSATPQMAPEPRVREALRIGESLSGGVRGPFVVESLAVNG